MAALKGFGTTFIGMSDMRKDNSYIATEWFIVFHIPIYPVKSCRVMDGKTRANPILGYTQEYTVLERLPLQWRQVGMVYLTMLAIAAGIALMAYSAIVLNGTTSESVQSVVEIVRAVLVLGALVLFFYWLVKYLKSLREQ